MSAVRLRLVQSSRCEEHCSVFEEFDGEKEAGDGARTRRHRAQDVRPAHVVRLVRFFVREVEGRANVNAAPKHDDADDVEDGCNTKKNIAGRARQMDLLRALVMKAAAMVARSSLKFIRCDFAQTQTMMRTRETMLLMKPITIIAWVALNQATTKIRQK